MSYVAVGVSLAMLVAGTAINYENTQEASNKRDQAAAQEIQQQTGLQKKANQDTQALLNKDQANNSDTSQRSQLLDSFQKAIAAHANTSTGGLNQVGNVSSAYTKAANDAALGVSNYANSQAGSLADMGAPTLQRQGENAGLAQLGSQIGGIQQQSAADQGLANIKMQGTQANPWLAAIAGGLTSAGSSGMGGSGGMGGMLSGGYGAGSAASAGNGYMVNLPYASTG